MYFAQISQTSISIAEVSFTTTPDAWQTIGQSGCYEGPVWSGEWCGDNSLDRDVTQDSGWYSAWNEYSPSSNRGERRDPFVAYQSMAGAVTITQVCIQYESTGKGCNTDACQGRRKLSHVSYHTA